LAADRRKDDLIANNHQAIVAFTPPMADDRAAAGAAKHASPPEDAQAQACPEGGREHAVLAGRSAAGCPAAGRGAPRLPAARPRESLRPVTRAAAAYH